MTYRRWEMRDPLEVLIRKGEGCTNCRWLEPWKSQAVCAKGKKVGKRCSEWKHEQGDAEQ